MRLDAEEAERMARNIGALFDEAAKREEESRRAVARQGFEG
jgi:hypothetical protein